MCICCGLLLACEEAAVALDTIWGPMVIFIWSEIIHDSINKALISRNNLAGQDLSTYTGSYESEYRGEFGRFVAVTPSQVTEFLLVSPHLIPLLILPSTRHYQVISYQDVCHRFITSHAISI